MEEDDIPIPPTRVKDAYLEATPLLYKLGENPEDEAVLKQLEEINNRIKKGNKSQNAETENESERVSDSQWLIPATFFGPHYEVVLEGYRILHDHPEDQAVKRRISIEKELIDALIRKHHFPAEWTVTSADDYLKERHSEAAVADAVAAELPKLEGVHVEYPWPTARGRWRPDYWRATTWPMWNTGVHREGRGRWANHPST